MRPPLIYAPKGDTLMRVASFVSGSGTNARRIIERSYEEDSRFEVSLIFSDVRDGCLLRNGKKRCRAKDIADEYGIPYEYEDIRDFYREKGEKRSDLSLRPEYDRLVVEKLAPHRIDLIALAGYMSITTWPLLEAYRGRIVNVHPADLSLLDGNERKYVGIHVIRDAILAGESELRASTHVVRDKVDHGEILVVSRPIPVRLPEGIVLRELALDKHLLSVTVDEHQEELKRQGDWVIFPLTIQMIAAGFFALDGEGGVYVNGVLSPGGYRF
ncbi:formyl transferase [Candidatus Bathyarchaeota archaeon]|nr:formyl transferase [Candidatus Bathyarchaeota archaeon]|tara:strand:- start:121 stop:933 length:813 start_codon:yes stop_codon:yes gene_type:complete